MAHPSAPGCGLGHCSCQPRLAPPELYWQFLCSDEKTSNMLKHQLFQLPASGPFLRPTRRLYTSFGHRQQNCIQTVKAAKASPNGPQPLSWPPRNGPGNGKLPTKSNSIAKVSCLATSRGWIQEDCLTCGFLRRAKHSTTMWVCFPKGTPFFAVFTQETHLFLGVP